MAAKLLTLLISTFLLLSLISNNINVNAAETETGVEDGLGSDNLNDEANGALPNPIDEQENENASDKTVDEKDNKEVENKNKDEKETDKESSTKEGDGVNEESEQAVNKEDVDNSQDKRGKNGGGRRRRRNNLRNRGTTAEPSLQELPVSENTPEGEEDIEEEPTIENIEDSQTTTATVIQESKDNKRGSKRGKNQKKRGAALKNQNAAKLKARPARRQPAKSAKRSTKKFQTNGKQFPKTNKGKAANSNGQRQKGRVGRRSKFGKRN